MNCDTCKYSDNSPTGHLECRRNPPQVFWHSSTGMQHQAWPEVKRIAWCGEYKRNPGAKQA